MFKDINETLKVRTHRSGHFTFQIGVSTENLQPLIDRVEDAHSRFVAVPMLPQIARDLQQSVVVSSVFGTNTIEGGTLTEEEIDDLFKRAETPNVIKEEKERRVLNIRNAYDHAESLSASLKQENRLTEGRHGVPYRIDEDLILTLHELITKDLTHPRNVPGVYRDNPKGFHTRVGDADHGGTYTPPKCIDDIRLLIQGLIQWINSDAIIELHPLIRAPLLHYYFERIHPFWDGNGRVGRVLEAIVLKCSGMMYAPFGLARSYLEHIDEYFTVFNTSRKLEQKGEAYPNTPFVEFFLHRLREVFNHLHDHVNQLIGIVLFENSINHYLHEKIINARQYTIINNLYLRPGSGSLSEIQSKAWYKALYSNLTRRTRDRDIRKLIDLGIIRIDKENRVELIIPGS